MAADDASPQGGDKSQGFASAADKLRETAKWLLAALGALGAALVASLSLTDVGDATGSDLAWGIAGFALGLTGTWVAIASVAYVLTYFTTSISDLVGSNAREDLAGLFEKHPYVLGGYKNIDSLARSYLKAQEERIETYETMLGVPQQNESELIVAIASYERAQNRVDLMSPLVDRALDFSAFERLRRRFKRALVGVFLGFVLASTGVGLYSYFVSQPSGEAQEGAVDPVPVESTLDLTAAGEDAFAEILGESCELDEIDVVALSSSAESTRVVVSPESRCNVVALNVPPELGIVIPKPGSPGSGGATT